MKNNFSASSSTVGLFPGQCGTETVTGDNCNTKRDCH